MHRMARTVIGILVMPILLMNWSHLGYAATAVDFFVYDGTQSNLSLPSGTVVSVSTANNELALCINVPSSSDSNGSYTANCNTGAAPGSGDSSYYSSVIFIGAYQDANQVSHNLFAVGDNAGNIYLMEPTINSAGAPQTLIPYGSPYSFNCGKVSCGVVTALAKDPTGQYLYISFAHIDFSGKGDGLADFYDANGTVVVQAPQAVLMSVPINGDGTLGTALNSYYNFAWQNYSTDGISGSGVYNYVAPSLRVYPPSYPGLPSQTFVLSGAVFYSGIVSNALNDGNPLNTGYLCSGGSCQIAYNIKIQEKDGAGVTGTYYYVMTSSEYGVDSSGPVLYWNQVPSTTILRDGGNLPAIVTSDKIINSVISCDLVTPVSAVITSSPCRSSSTLAWPPGGAPTGYTDPYVNQLIYLPTPAGYSNPSETGVLMMGLYDPGYLVYHSVMADNEATNMLFLNSGSNGELGNVPYGMTSDQNSSLLVQVGGAGLIGFNIFANQNLGDSADSVTYIQVTSDDTDVAADCGATCKVLNGMDIEGVIISNIALAVALAPPSNESLTNRLAKRKSLRDERPGDGFTLGRLFGRDSYWGEFVYSEQEVNAAGIKRGQKIRGIQLELGKGVGPRPSKNIRMGNFTISLTQDWRLGNQLSSNFLGSTVRRGELSIKRNSYNHHRNSGFGPVIRFNKPYKYRGGDLKLTIRHSGALGVSIPFWIDAIRRSGVKGSYSSPLTYESAPARTSIINVAPQVRFIR